MALHAYMQRGSGPVMLLQLSTHPHQTCYTTKRRTIDSQVTYLPVIFRTAEHVSQTHNVQTMRHQFGHWRNNTQWPLRSWMTREA
jgi:hypothetical protein